MGVIRRDLAASLTTARASEFVRARLFETQELVVKRIIMKFRVTNGGGCGHGRSFSVARGQNPMSPGGSKTSVYLFTSKF